jgi:hypothetical protein
MKVIHKAFGEGQNGAQVLTQTLLFSRCPPPKALLCIKLHHFYNLFCGTPQGYLVGMF